MNDKFKEQKEVLEALLHEIKLLGQQVGYLIRNGKEVGLLDLDVMMNRTHTIYDTICGMSTAKDEDFEWDEGLMEKILGGTANMEEEEETANLTNLEEEEGTANLANLTNLEETKEMEGVDFGFIFRPAEKREDEGKDETEEEKEVEEEVKEVEEEVKEEEKKEEILEFEFNLSAGEIEEEEEPEKEVYTSGDQIEMVIPHFEIKEETEELGEIEKPEEIEEIEKAEEIEEVEGLEEIEEVEDPEEIEEIEKVEEGKEEEEEVVEEIEEIKEEKKEETEFFPYEPVMFGDMEEKEELGFELMPETLGEKLQEEEDHSLAAKLQHKKVTDLRTAIGINDKFLLVNELFAGSMERYNKSIENLNDLPTLDGALGYMDELYVQYQWNRNNEAYKKLMDLVRRKFD